MSAELDAGHVLRGKYRIDRKSATGSLGDEVYIGYHLDLNCEILIRVLPPSMTAKKETAERFVQGVRLTAALQHPNILPAYDAGEEDGRYFFVTGYEKGYFLKEYISHRGKLGEVEAVKIIDALAGALELAWEKKIIHRNICPDTIIIARENNPMLTDFGMAKSQESEQRLTMEGFIVGNPQYMSPEQVRAEKEIDFHADMYCLGLVFYELLAGRPAFESKSQVALLVAQETEQPASLKELNREVSDRCVAVVGKMIEKDKAKRYPTWSALSKELKKLLEPQAAPKAAQAKGKAPSEDPDKKIKEFVQLLAKENRRKLKRNILIGTVIVNLAIIAIAAKYFYDKQKEAQAKAVPAKTATP